MSEWIGIIIGLGFAFYGFKRGFYEIWAILFNIAVSVYLGIFLWLTIIDTFPVLGKTSFSAAMTVLITSAVVFTILQSFASLLLIGQFNVILPKVLDTAGAAVLGFLSGMLVWSFISLIITFTPLYEIDFVKKLGITDYARNEKSTSLIWWGDFFNKFAGTSDDKHTTENVINELIAEIKAKQQKEKTRKATTARTETLQDKSEAQQEPAKKKLVGPPPEPNLDAL